MKDRTQAEIAEGKVAASRKREVYEDHQLLRDVNIEGYRLTLWDTYRFGAFGKSKLGYMLCDPDGKILFDGEDYCCGAATPVDSDEAVRGILEFLTLRPGDTDGEYFENYTEEQMAFAEGEAEEISLYAMEEGDGCEALGFTDWNLTNNHEGA